MSTPVRYLSAEWEAEIWKEAPIDTSDNGFDCGWGWDGPCGGCDRCLSAQLSYYISKERDRARVFLNAGFGVSNPDLITLGWHPGFGGYHDAYNCWCSKERTEITFPWETG